MMTPLNKRSEMKLRRHEMDRLVYVEKERHNYYNAKQTYQRCLYRSFPSPLFFFGYKRSFFLKPLLESKRKFRENWKLPHRLASTLLEFSISAKISSCLFGFILHKEDDYTASLVVVTELRHINVDDFANEENLMNGWDVTFNCYYINEDVKRL
ncbi:hypothetical protein H5410_029765 [Solanum commersonii]|uniref:Uncharacterized protein n=1 Tax=Solanum commersonii TaxID=4109 RepID=A0A9J5YCE3_SOLCO|nr:hypothetical protein H5410_029765 [Solanum commersonii]